MKTLLAAAVLLSAMASSAHAGIGVGAEAMINGPTGVALVYDHNRAFRVDGILGIYDAAATELHLGGRFFYNVHAADRADFGIGGGLGYVHTSGVDTDELFLEVGAQIRVFLVSNVAVTATLGLSIAALDAEGFDLTGQLLGSGGIVYFF